MTSTTVYTQICDRCGTRRESDDENYHDDAPPPASSWLMVFSEDHPRNRRTHDFCSASCLQAWAAELP